MRKLLPLIVLSLSLAGCKGLTPAVFSENVKGAVHDAQVDKENHPEKYAIADAIPYTQGLGGVALFLGTAVYAFVQRSKKVGAKTALRQVVTGVQSVAKTPELKAALSAATDEATKALVESVKATLPKSPEVVAPELVTK